MLFQVMLYILRKFNLHCHVVFLPDAGFTACLKFNGIDASCLPDRFLSSPATVSNFLSLKAMFVKGISISKSFQRRRLQDIARFFGKKFGWC